MRGPWLSVVTISMMALCAGGAVAELTTAPPRSDGSRRPAGEWNVIDLTGGFDWQQVPGIEQLVDQIERDESANRR